MNEIAAMCDGDECHYEKNNIKVKNDFDPNNPPYLPGGINQIMLRGKIRYKYFGYGCRRFLEY
jgi:hypothetical protein